MTALLLVVTATTVLGMIVIVVRHGPAALATVLGVVCEVVGATVVFFFANVLAGVTVILGARWLSLFYTTLYDVADVTVLIVALLQALTATLWLQRRD